MTENVSASPTRTPGATAPAGELVRTLDCSRYSEDRHSPACQERADEGVGIIAALVVLGVVLALALSWWWRRRYGRAPDEDTPVIRRHDPRWRTWWRTRQEREERAEAARQELRDEYVAKLEARDPDVLETSRDWSDNSGTPWRLEVFVAGVFLVLLVGVPLLIVLFLAVKVATGG